MNESDRGVRPGGERLLALILEATSMLASYPQALRPRSPQGRPGGLVLPPQPQCILVPDLHAREDFLPQLLDASVPHARGRRVRDLLKEGELGVLCLGDILHSEGEEARSRWMRAAARLLAEEESKAYSGPELEDEMGRSIRSLEGVLAGLVEFPGAFFCLKGNHDNMGNLDEGGDRPFYKYALEGMMGAAWFSRAYGAELLGALREYERSLPLVAAGRGFFASHAEPRREISLSQLLDYRSHPRLVYDLIWTADGEAEENSVDRSIMALQPLVEKAFGPAEMKREDVFWFSGHRPVGHGWKPRTDGFVQIHDPKRNQVLWVGQAGGPRLWVVDRQGLRPAESPAGLDRRGAWH